MNKVVSTIGILGLLMTGTVASDLLSGQKYGSIGLAMTDPTGSWDSGISVVLTGGMKLDNVFPNLAAEVEISQTISDPSYTWSGYGYSYDVDVSILGIGAYAVYNFQVPNTPIVIKPRLGLNHQRWSIGGRTTGWGGAGSDGSDIELSFGVGANYALPNGLMVYADFTDKGDSNNIGAGIGKSF